MTVFFIEMKCFKIAYLHCCISASHPDVWLSRWLGACVSLTLCLHWPCGMLCQFSPCHQAVGCLNSPAICIARVPLLPSGGTWSLVHHGFCTLWTVFETYYLPCFLLALVAPFSRGCLSALLGEYVPFFPQGVFSGFRIRRIHLKSVPAHQTHARFALINNVSIVGSWLGF